MEKPEITMTDTEYIEWLRRRILVHSHIYYNLNDNVIADKKFDLFCHTLVEIQKVIQDSSLKYHDAFKDFDGSTGFDLMNKLSQKDRDYIEIIASHVLKNYKEKRYE
jgi:NAD-dependent DNA ligase